MCAHLLSRVQLFVTPWTVVHQASLSMVFSRQEYWSGLPFPSPGDLPNPEIEPASLVSPAFPTEPQRSPILTLIFHYSIRGYPCYKPYHLKMDDLMIFHIR